MCSISRFVRVMRGHSRREAEIERQGELARTATDALQRQIDAKVRNIEAAAALMQSLKEDLNK